ncbi:MAG: hypothetical protein Q8S21_02240 [Candidatus Paracaedibacteraceae bacterium]|nr:hypothetical protein [Candidatus Paracaedibacteraceae bacterium]
MKIKNIISLVGILSSVFSLTYARDTIQYKEDTFEHSNAINMNNVTLKNQNDESHILFVNTSLLTNGILKKFVNLQTLSVSKCTQITGSVFDVISNSSPNLRSLQLSDLPNLRMLCARTYFTKRSNQPLIFGQLEHLHISSQENLTGIHLRAPKLKFLNVSHCKNLASFIVESENLEDIDLTGNTTLSFDLLWQFLYQQNQCPNLLHLDDWIKISNRSLFSQHTDKNFRFIVTLLPLSNAHQKIMLSVYENRASSELNLNNHEIGDMEGVSLAEALLVNTTLVSLNLSRNGIKEFGGRKLAESLKANKFITKLMLDNNSISSGALSFTEVIRHNTTLEEFSLKENILTCDIIKTLIQSLEFNFRLHIFNLSEHYTYEEDKGTGKYRCTPGPHGDGYREEIMITHHRVGNRVRDDDQATILKFLNRNKKIISSQGSIQITAKSGIVA